MTQSNFQNRSSYDHALIYIVYNVLTLFIATSTLKYNFKFKTRPDGERQRRCGIYMYILLEMHLTSWYFRTYKVFYTKKNTSFRCKSSRPCIKKKSLKLNLCRLLFQKHRPKHIISKVLPPYCVYHKWSLIKSWILIDFFQESQLILRSLLQIQRNFNVLGRNLYFATHFVSNRACKILFHTCKIHFI